jgi:hypothetical protein
VLLTKYHQSDELKEEEIREACSIYGEKVNVCKDLAVHLKERDHLHRWDQWRRGHKLD